jgi:hypothetical protein
VRLEPDTKLFRTMRNLVGCVNAQEEFSLNTVAACQVCYHVHICKGGESCDLTDDGTCCYTNKSFDGLARTHALTMEGLPDSASNAITLTNSRKSVRKRKRVSAIDGMDLEAFTSGVHKGFMYVEGVDKATPPIPLEEGPLAAHIRTLCGKVHEVMAYNSRIKKTRHITGYSAWVDSTIQVLRVAHGKSLIPNMASTPSVKAIVVEIMSAVESHKKMWWAKRPCITRQWKL